MEDIRILFVDDEKSNLNAVVRLLRKAPYIQFFTSSAAGAMVIMKNWPIHIIVTDIKMPVMDGLSLLHVVKKKYPNTVRLALSAYTEPALLLPAINSAEIFRYMTKPVDPAELQQHLQEAVDHYLRKVEPTAAMSAPIDPSFTPTSNHSPQSYLFIDTNTDGNRCISIPVSTSGGR